MIASSSQITWIELQLKDPPLESIDLMICMSKGIEMFRLKQGYILLRSDSCLDVKVTYMYWSDSV